MLNRIDIQYQLIRIPALLFVASVLFTCQTKTERDAKRLTAKSNRKSADRIPATKTDTLQFIHFEGNFDYWSCVFLNAERDTITLVTDSMIAETYKNRLFEVKWFTDTLTEAGDNESKYAADRMTAFKVVNGKPFVAPITEAQMLRDVRNLPEVLGGADQVGIASRPTESNNYYLVETGTREEDNYSRFLMFRIYTYPNYQIKVYDPSADSELSLEEWRKNKSSN